MTTRKKELLKYVMTGAIGLSVINAQASIALAEEETIPEEQSEQAETVVEDQELEVNQENEKKEYILEYYNKLGNTLVSSTTIETEDVNTYVSTHIPQGYHLVNIRHMVENVYYVDILPVGVEMPTLTGSSYDATTNILTFSFENTEIYNTVKIGLYFRDDSLHSTFVNFTDVQVTGNQASIQVPVQTLLEAGFINNFTAAGNFAFYKEDGTFINNTFTSNTFDLPEIFDLQITSTAIDEDDYKLQVFLEAEDLPNNINLWRGDITFRVGTNIVTTTVSSNEVDIQGNTVVINYNKLILLLNTESKKTCTLESIKLFYEDSVYGVSTKDVSLSGTFYTPKFDVPSANSITFFSTGDEYAIRYDSNTYPPIHNIVRAIHIYCEDGSQFSVYDDYSITFADACYNFYIPKSKFSSLGYADGTYKVDFIEVEFYYPEYGLPYKDGKVATANDNIIIDTKGYFPQTESSITSVTTSDVLENLTTYDEIQLNVKINGDTDAPITIAYLNELTNSIITRDVYAGALYLGTEFGYSNRYKFLYYSISSGKNGEISKQKYYSYLSKEELSKYNVFVVQEQLNSISNPNLDITMVAHKEDKEAPVCMECGFTSSSYQYEDTLQFYAKIEDENLDIDNTYALIKINSQNHKVNVSRSIGNLYYFEINLTYDVIHGLKGTNTWDPGTGEWSDISACLYYLCAKDLAGNVQYFSNNQIYLTLANIDFTGYEELEDIRTTIEVPYTYKGYMDIDYFENLHSFFTGETYIVDTRGATFVTIPKECNAAHCSVLFVNGSIKHAVQYYYTGSGNSATSLYLDFYKESERTSAGLDAGDLLQAYSQNLNAGAKLELRYYSEDGTQIYEKNGSSYHAVSNQTSYGRYTGIQIGNEKQYVLSNKDMSIVNTPVIYLTNITQYGNYANFYFVYNPQHELQKLDRVTVRLKNTNDEIIFANGYDFSYNYNTQQYSFQINLQDYVYKGMSLSDYYYDEIDAILDISNGGQDQYVIFTPLQGAPIRSKKVTITEIEEKTNIELNKGNITIQSISSKDRLDEVVSAYGIQWNMQTSTDHGNLGIAYYTFTYVSDQGEYINIDANSKNIKLENSIRFKGSKFTLIRFYIEGKNEAEDTYYYEMFTVRNGKMYNEAGEYQCDVQLDFTLLDALEGTPTPTITSITKTDSDSQNTYLTCTVKTSSSYVEKVKAYYHVQLGNGNISYVKSVEADVDTTLTATTQFNRLRNAGSTYDLIGVEIISYNGKSTYYGSQYFLDYAMNYQNPNADFQINSDAYQHYYDDDGNYWDRITNPNYDTVVIGGVEFIHIGNESYVIPAQINKMIDIDSNVYSNYNNNEILELILKGKDKDPNVSTYVGVTLGTFSKGFTDFKENVFLSNYYCSIEKQYGVVKGINSVYDKNLSLLENNQEFMSSLQAYKTANPQNANNIQFLIDYFSADNNLNTKNLKAIFEKLEGNIEYLDTVLYINRFKQGKIRVQKREGWTLVAKADNVDLEIMDDNTTTYMITIPQDISKLSLYYVKNNTIEMFEQDNTNTTLKGYTVSFGSEIGLNFYYSNNGNSSKRIVFTLENGKKIVSELTYDFLLRGYRSTATLSAKEMNDIVKAQVLLGNGKLGEISSYSIAQYAKYIVNNSSSYKTNAVNLVKYMINFGASAQKYFNYHTDRIFTYSNTMIPLLTNYTAVIEGSSDTVKFIGARLVLDSDLGLKLYFNGKGDFYVDGEKVDTTLEGKYTVITIQNAYLDPKHLYTIDVDKLKVTYGVYSFCINARKSTDSSLVELGETLPIFYNAFDAYRKSTSYDVLIKG